MELKKYTQIFFVIILLIGCVTETPLNNEFRSIEPKEIGDGLVVSTPSSENVNTTQLSQIYEETYSDEQLWSIRSLLVFRNGKLIAESYMKDDNDIVTHHLIWSCTKQVVGVLVGIAVDKGLIESLDDPLSKYLPEEASKYPDKADITIRNLITMQSGIDYNNSGSDGETDKILRQLPDNIVEFILDRPQKNSPGATFQYKDGDPQLISAILQKVTGKPTDEWADEVLFSKIGMTNYNWVRYKDGTTLGGFGIETTPRELAKVALCVADSGKWKGQQIIKPNWVEEMTSTQVQVNDSDFSFGYYWWIDDSRDIHFMWGHGGQYAFVIPSKNIVVMMTAIPNTQGEYEVQVDDALRVVDKIIDVSNL
ncbi:MAG: serine hydrolase [Ignavibacteriae bacterium]|nr:serine hydrolase [Ignavibacteriota bacterium]